MASFKEKAAKEGIEIELIEFADYTLPNNALAQGDIDLNAFQHISFLSQYVKESGNDLVPIGSTMFAPLGVYSEKIKDIREIKKGDKIAIPDDPSNQARALRLLESADLITLSDSFGLFGDPSGIVENPLNFDIIPMVATTNTTCCRTLLLLSLTMALQVKQDSHLVRTLYIKKKERMNPSILMSTQ